MFQIYINEETNNRSDNSFANNNWKELNDLLRQNIKPIETDFSCGYPGTS